MNNSKSKSKNDRQLGVIPEHGFMRKDQVLSVLPIGATSLYDGIKAGRYPKPVKLSGRTSAWRVEDIRKLIAELGGAA